MKSLVELSMDKRPSPSEALAVFADYARGAAISADTAKDIIARAGMSRPELEEAFRIMEIGAESQASRRFPKDAREYRIAGAYINSLLERQMDF